MSKPVPIDDSNFEQTVLKAEKPVLIDFWAPRCRPCLMVAPVVDELADEFEGRVSFVKMDIDQNPQTASKYNIMSIPALLIFKNGEPVSHMTGLRSKEDLKKNLDEALG